METRLHELRAQANLYSSINDECSIKDFPKGYISFREFSKDDIIKIVENEEKGIDDFLVFDISSVLVDTKINYDSIVYLIYFNKKSTDSIDDRVKNIEEFTSHFPNSIIIARRGIPHHDLTEFIPDITAIQKAGFVDINSFCQLEYSLPFLFIRNSPSQSLYEEIATMVFKPVKPVENND